MVGANGRGSLDRGDDQMRRPLSIALASLFVAVMVAPTAQSATRYYHFQDFQPAIPGHLAIHLLVVYKNKQRHGPYTPRLTAFDDRVPTSCNPPVSSDAFAQSGSGNGYIKLRKGSFNYSYSSAYVNSDPPGNISATLTGKVLEKKKGKQLRVNGSVSILDFDYPPPGWHNCTSGGPVPYSATPCRYGQRPPYIKPGLPVCYGGP